VPSTGAVPLWLARPIALGGLLFFVDALLYFAYSYVTVFARELPGPVNRAAILVDVTLFTVFALHHSVFARDIIRKRITRIVGALERSIYVWTASALFIAVCAWWQPVASIVWRVDHHGFVWLLAAGQLLGVWLTLRSALMIDVLELAGLRQLRQDRTPPPSEFTTTGPYGWVRHPIYAGWFLLVFSVPLMTMTRFVFATISCIYLLAAIPFEERSLRCSSSGSYDAYMRKVQWKLLPGLF
jgi:protein-S-isoprenylcysteine O-methyltransferase Ste14